MFSDPMDPGFMKNNWLRFPAKMRTLLRKVTTGLYLRGPDQWTNNPAEALDFQMIDRALKFAQSLGLTDMELAFAFPESGQVTRVPLDRIGSRYSEG